MENDLLSSAEVADLLGVEPETVRAYARDGEFPNARRTSGRRFILRIPRSDVDALLARWQAQYEASSGKAVREE